MNTWYTIRAQKELGITEIFIDNEIGEFGIPARTFLNELRANDAKLVKLHINSPGGSLIDAFAIYDFIKLKGYEVVAYISGIAASAATVISSAAKEVYIGEHSYFFIHNPYYAASNGPKADLQKMKNDLLDIYHKKTGIAHSLLSKMMDDETLLSASEALEWGFVDGISKEAKVAALKLQKRGFEKLNNLVNQNTNSILISKLNTSASIKSVGDFLEVLKSKLTSFKTRKPIFSSIKPIINNMDDTKELQAKLEELINQLTALLQELSGEEAPPEDPAKEQGKEQEMQKKDATIQGLREELARIKAKRLENRQRSTDADPTGAEAASRKGWNYVSSYLQNHFR
ncbi:MAG: Clp protease ClpP [Chitinophagales bacterium]|nr:Clp protease ClpP [Chitinophagales bacterium]